MDIVSTKKINTIATNVTRNCYNKKLRDYYILHKVLLAIILLLIIIIIIIICYHYAEQKGIDALKI